MPVSKAFKVVEGGFTTLAGEIDNVARAGVAGLRRQMSALTDRLATVEGDYVTGASGLVVPDTLALNDDQAAYLEFDTDASRGLLVLSPNVSAGGVVAVAFRVQSSAYATALATAGATVTVGTGTLAGTTGTDTHLTIRADTATNRLYVENRTGTNRAWGVVLLCMATGLPSTGTWVTV